MITQTEPLIILDIIRKPNSIIVLLYIHNQGRKHRSTPVEQTKYLIKINNKSTSFAIRQPMKQYFFEELIKQ